MPVQTSVVQYQKPGARGLVAKAEARNLISRSLKIGSAAMAFGVPVYRNGVVEDSVSLTAADGDFLGLSRRSGVVNPLNVPADSYIAGDEVPLMTEGVMWVETADAVVPGVPAQYNTATPLAARSLRCRALSSTPEPARLASPLSGWFAPSRHSPFNP
jgi:hypothetical protein